MSLADRCAKLTTPARRALALLVVPLFAVVLCATLGTPAFHLRDAQADWRKDTRRLLSQARHAPQSIAALERQIAAMRVSPLWSKFYTSTGAGSVSATTSLQADVSALLTDAQATAQSLTPIPAQELTFCTKLGVRLAVSMRVNQLQRLLTALADHPRYLRVERLIVVAPQIQREDENPPLAITMDVYGYQLPARASQVTQSTTLAMGERR